MKSVTFSDIERISGQTRDLPATAAPRSPYLALALLLALGLPALMIAFHLFDPAAPLGYIVVPVLAGGLLPVTQMMSGRLEVTTRFDACHLVGTLDDALTGLGYAPAERAPGTVRYRANGGRWARLRDKDISVTVREHVLEVTGPVPALRALRSRL